MASKLDLRRTLREFYTAPTGRPVLVDVPPLQYLMIDGQGDPNTSTAYRDALETLYGLSYTLKFAVKGGPLAIDYVVMGLEGLWWAADMGSFLTGDRAAWQWTAMILQPDLITPAMVDEARAELVRKRNPASAPLARLERYAEGQSAQIMHVGPYAAEGPTIELLHRFIAEQGYQPGGKHHEIYLSDPRRTAPDRMRTLIRQPVAIQGSRR